ncbi:MAG: ATP-binding cassette domain-containing protein [Betaproteobacteria bacterium AqS2]|uniref:ATP-binding cassette domain-containing protein n=1 Tax=Candidatus Amphirhobacter heronislandensis TaxID=1732024 RepID=A0A930UJ64_9GAMM|nr:ATP-binding cassette domain-containing protein [Betaproteobacteria bacterium AqS2]
MPKIELEGLSKAYEDGMVVAGLDLTMPDGEFTVIVGASGCGKSTTLRMIAGLEEASAGRIVIDGRDVTRLEPKERDIAMVFQDYALYPHMDVARNMSFALRLARRPKAEIDERVKAAAAALDLLPYLHRKPSELSGGQRQRVAMGRALTRDAGTFLFDEPLSNLDAKLRVQMRIELALMSRRLRKNMIYVTHDQVEAMTLGHRIVVMDGGRIMQAGPPEELYERPANRFVGGFLGSPPMNFLPGDIVQHNGAPALKGEGYTLILSEARQKALAARQGGGKVVAGIRPADFVRGDSGIDMEILVSEYIGSRRVLTAAIGERQVMVEAGAEERAAPGDACSFTVAAERIHLFDDETGKAIGGG